MAKKKYDLTGKLGVDDTILEDLTREVDEELVEAIQSKDPTEEQIERRVAYWEMFRNESERMEARFVGATAAIHYMIKNDLLKKVNEKNDMGQPNLLLETESKRW